MAGRRSLYALLSKKYRRVIDAFVKSLDGYQRSSVDTYKRKAAKYLLFCQERGLNFMDERSLELYKQKVVRDDYTRAKFFVRRLQELQTAELVPAEEETQQASAQVDSPAFDLKTLEENLMQKVESLLASFREKVEEKLKRFEKAEKAEEDKSGLLIGKPVKIKMLNGETVKGEIKLIDDNFLYVLVGEEERKPVKAKGKFVRWQDEQVRQKLVLKVVPRDVIETIEVPAELLDL
jgi:small nuclear ribonucleoprotein (snRNP)-like protein